MFVVSLLYFLMHLVSKSVQKKIVMTMVISNNTPATCIKMSKIKLDGKCCSLIEVLSLVLTEGRHDRTTHDYQKNVKVQFPPNSIAG